MFSEYRDYILNIRNSLIRNGIELDIDPTDDYEKLFYLGEGLGQILWLYNIFGRVGCDLALSDTLLPLNDTYGQKIRRRVFEKFCENEVDLRVANEGYNKDEIIDLWGTVEKEKPTEVVGTIENIPTTLKEKLSQMLNRVSKQGSEVKEESGCKEEGKTEGGSKIEEKSDDRYINSDDFGDYEWIFERARAIESAKKAHDEGNKVSNSGSDEKVYVDIDDLFKTGDGWVCDMVGHKFVIERPVRNVSDEKPVWDDSDDDWSSDPEEDSEGESNEEGGSEEEDQDDSDLFSEWDTSDDEDSESDVDEDSESEDDFGDNWGDDEDSEDEGSEVKNGSTGSSENDFSDWGSTEEDDDDFADWGSDDDENDNSDLDKWVDNSTGHTPTWFNSGSESRDTVRRSLSPKDLALEKEIARIDESVERVSNLISKGFSTLRKLPKKAMKDIGKTE